MDEKKHRGRIQAQGGKTEKSVKWAQDEPLTKDDGLNLLAELKKLLTDKELREREEQFTEAERYIQNVQGGADAIKKKSFHNRKTQNIRVDIEILGGTAFVIFVLFILFAAFVLK